MTPPPTRFGSPARTRTTDMLVNSQPLYRLSYWGIFFSNNSDSFRRTGNNEAVTYYNRASLSTTYMKNYRL